MQRRALTIAGSDSGGGAGIQADLKTFMSFRVHGSSSITAITAQNTVGVQDIEPLRPDIVTHQIVSVLSDIGADSIKIGMLFSSDIINAVADTLEEFRSIPLIIDPVMVATAQSRPLLSPNAIDTFKTRLLPMAYILTPNIPEAEVLTGVRI
ncbi:pyridoxamine kinase, partial [Chytridium lagenaria]